MEKIGLPFVTFCEVLVLLRYGNISSLPKSLAHCRLSATAHSAQLQVKSVLSMNIIPCVDNHIEEKSCVNIFEFLADV